MKAACASCASSRRTSRARSPSFPAPSSSRRAPCTTTASAPAAPASSASSSAKATPINTPSAPTPSTPSPPTSASTSALSSPESPPPRNARSINMFPLRHDLDHLARQHQEVLLREAAEARLVREARRAAGHVSLRVRVGDAVYGLALALSGLAGVLGSERAKRGVTGGSEGG